MDRSITIASSTLLFFFFLFFTFSSARYLFDSPLIDLDTTKYHDPLSFYENINSDHHDFNSILLPTDNKPEPEPATTLIQLEPEPVTAANSRTSYPKPETVKLTEAPKEELTTSKEPDPAEAAPLTVFTFHPIDRCIMPTRPISKPKPKPKSVLEFAKLIAKLKKAQAATAAKSETVKLTEAPKTETASSKPSSTIFNFPPIHPRNIPKRPSSLSIHLGHHRCHHSHPYKPWKPRLPQMPRKNDAVELNRAELDKDFDSVAREAKPAEPVPVRRTESTPSRERIVGGLDNKRSELMLRFYGRNQRRGHNDSGEPEKKGTGLMKRIRKFLNPF